MKKLALCVLVAGYVYGQNVVTDWAGIVQPIVNTPPKSPAVQYYTRAVIQIAVYDAVMAIEGGFTPYAAAIPKQPTADVRAAVATAAYRAARPFVTPAQSAVLDAQYEAYMGLIPDGSAKSAGVAIGQSAASAIQGARNGDGYDHVVLYDCLTNPPRIGRFEPDGGCLTQPVNTNFPGTRPFAIPSSSQFRPTGPEPMSSISYLEDFMETRDMGRADSKLRTAEQTDIAYFWQVFDAHQALLSLALSRGLSVRDASRFFAMVYVASADSAIAGLDAKYYYNFWRPRTAIPRADLDGNPETDPDPTWKPLLLVNHPEYPSGHAFVSNAMFNTVARFFGSSKVAMTFTASKAAAPQLVKTERSFTNLSSLLHEIDDARVWAGLHFRHSLQSGAEVGRRVAEYVCENFFQPQP